MSALYHHICDQTVNIILTNPASILSTIVNNEWSKDDIEKVVMFLDQIAAWDFKKLDKCYSVHKLVERRLAVEFEKRLNNVYADSRTLLTNIVFQIRDYFQLSSKLTLNSIFRQKLGIFMEIEKFAKVNYTDEHDLNYVTNINLLAHDDNRFQFAILKHFVMENQLNKALFFAILLEIPESTWPLEISEKVKENEMEAQRLVVKEFSKRYKPPLFAIVNFCQPGSMGLHDFHYESLLHELIAKIISERPTEYLEALEQKSLNLKQLTCIIEFLIKVALKHYTHLDECKLNGNKSRSKVATEMATKVSKKISCEKLVETICNICQHFKLPMTTNEDLIFVRKMLSLSTFYQSTYVNGNDIDFVYVKRICHLMRGCQRAKLGVLKFLSLKKKGDAIYFALMMDVPQNDWPFDLTKNNLVWETVDHQSQVVQKTKELLLMQYTKYANGFRISEKQHCVYFINNRETLYTRFFPFLNRNIEFNLETESQESFGSNSKILCLIKLTSHKETMLIDVMSLRKFFIPAEWVDFFSRIFKFPNIIFGFDLREHLQLITQTFPYLHNSNCTKFTNIICLTEVARRILEDPQKRNRIFGDNIPPENTLLEFVRYFSGIILVKSKEANAVWSEPPFLFSQLEYTATTSFCAFNVKQKLAQLINSRSPQDLNMLFMPIWSLNMY